MLSKKNKPAPETLVLTDPSIEDNSQEVSTRFLRDRENRLDRQTLRLAQDLIEAGFKVTDPRLTIIEEIVSFRHEFEVTDLAERIERRPGFKPGIASVFRTVKLLSELGL